MESMNISPKINVRHCSQCQGDTEYHCLTCEHNLCPSCKWSHDISLETQNHTVVLYKNKNNSQLKPEICSMHQDQVYEMYCQSCWIPVCFHCRNHRTHKSQNLRNTFENKQKQTLNSIASVRGERIYNARVLLAEINTDLLTSSEKEIVKLRSAIMKKSQRLKSSFDTLTSKICSQRKCLLNNKIFTQIMKMKTYLLEIQEFEQKVEQSVYRPVHFLLFSKNVRLPQMQDTPLPKLYRLSLNQEINIKHLIEVLSKVIITEGRKRQAENKHLLTLMPSPVLQKSLTMKDGFSCDHFSFVTPDLVWISDFEDLVLRNTTNTFEILYNVLDFLKKSFSGLHTVNSDCDLIYIDKSYNIKTLSNEKKISTTLIKQSGPWRPLSIHWSPSTGELMVGMFRSDRNTYTGQVRRYNNTGKITKTIPHNTSYTLYVYPHYITENNNGDVVVSDKYRNAVVVTDPGGRHRFSYTGPPSGSELWPREICTDTLAHILVCDGNTLTVQMLSKNGEFLSYLLTTESPGIHVGPQTVSYDVSTHLLWSGSGGSNISVYRYINRHLCASDKFDLWDENALFSSQLKGRSIPGHSQAEYEVIAARSRAKFAAARARDEAKNAKDVATKTVEGATLPEDDVAVAAATEARIKAEEAKSKADEAAEAAANATSVAAADEALNTAYKAKAMAIEANRIAVDAWGFVLNIYEDCSLDNIEDGNDEDDFGHDHSSNIFDRGASREGGYFIEQL